MDYACFPPEVFIIYTLPVLLDLNRKTKDQDERAMKINLEIPKRSSGKQKTGARTGAFNDSDI